MNKVIAVLTVILLIVIGIGVYFYFNRPNNQIPQTEVAQEATATPDEEDVETTNNIYGVVSNVSDDSLELDSAGDVYNFDIADASLPEDKIAEDDVIEIIYKGELGENTKASEIKIIDEVSSKNSKNSEKSNTSKSNSSKSNSSTEETAKVDDPNANHYITGEVVDVSTDAITIKTKSNGKSYSFTTIDAKKDNNIAVGDSVRVVHKGEVTNQKDSEAIEAVYVHKNK